MRKLIAVLVVLLGCLTFVGQSVASVSAGYSDCCLQGCKGMAHCVSATCQTCAMPQLAPMPERLISEPADTPGWLSTESRFDAGPLSGPWTPPD